MCGLVGIARNPNGPLQLETAVEALERGLRSIEHRGRHATGMAAIGGKENLLWKWAVTAQRFLNSKEWEKTRAEVPADTAVLMGHTRYATHNNAHRDDCAHPFAIGKVIGAHNGVVWNYEDVLQQIGMTKDEIKAVDVDSQAIFHAIDRIKDVNKALDLFDGYMALTWTKGRSLFLCRGGGGVLSAAYVPASRALLWHSERPELVKLLQSFKLTDKEYTVWDLVPNTLYRYEPATFGDYSGAETTPLTFKGIEEPYKKVDTTNAPKTGVGPRRGGSAPVYVDRRSVKPSPRRGGRRARESQERSREVAMEEAQRQLNARLAPPRVPSSAQISLSDLKGDVSLLYQYVSGLEEEFNEKLAELQSEVETLRAENDHLYSVVNELGLLDATEEETIEEDPDQPVLGEAFDKSSASAAVIAAQAARAARDECVECGWPETAGVGGRLLRLADGSHIHEACVLKNESSVAIGNAGGVA